MIQLDELSPVAFSVQVAAIIQEEIQACAYQPFTPVPSRTRLAARFGIDAKTAGRSHAILAARGYVVMVPGRGMIVRPREDWQQ